MKILFLCRGFGYPLQNPVVDAQCLSLRKAGVNVDVFYIPSGGVSGYLKAFMKLRCFLKNQRYDLIHAHYSFSGFLAGISFNGPIICSLMGSDILRRRRFILLLTHFLSKYIWKLVVVKSRQMLAVCPHAKLIPNGVDFKQFRPIAKQEALNRSGFDKSKKHIIFVATDAYAPVKNLSLAMESIRLLDNKEIEFHIVSGVSYFEMPYYYNAANVLLVTSLTEGSPNIVKEAMACNCPVVSTDVGDVREIIGNAIGCFIADHDPNSIAVQIEKSLKIENVGNLRDKVGYLSMQKIAVQILAAYKELMRND